MKFSRTFPSVLTALPLPALSIPSSLHLQPLHRWNTHLPCTPCSFPVPFQRPWSHPDELVLAKHHVNIGVTNVSQSPQKITWMLLPRLFLVNTLQHSALLDAPPTPMLTDTDEPHAVAPAPDSSLSPWFHPKLLLGTFVSQPQGPRVVAPSHPETKHSCFPPGWHRYNFHQIEAPGPQPPVFSSPGSVSCCCTPWGLCRTF